MRKAIYICVAVLGAAAPAHALAGPFGINAGDPITKYAVEAKTGPYSYRLRVTPVTRADVDFYSVLATPETGVCKVVAAGRNNADDPTGAKLRDQFLSLKSALNSKYGASKDFDFVKAGSAYAQDSQYTLAISKEDRSLTSFWGTGDAALPDNVKSIMLTAKALSATTNYYSLAYEFNNFTRCKQIIDAGAAGL
jgi:hypothetical protein